jgi:hypothetical protein
MPDETPDETAPTGLPEDQPEEQPLGVPDADPDNEDLEPGSGAMPGIPSEGEPPAAS